MSSRLEHRLHALEGTPRVYRSVAEMPDDALLAMLSPLCGGRAPTDDELRAIASGQLKAEGNNHAKP